MGDTDPAGKNKGLFIRSFYTAQSKELDLIGRLYVDVCQQDRLIVNGVPINIKLWQNSDRFRLLAKDDMESNKVRITEATLNVASVKVNPDVIIGQNDVIKTSSALYPYSRSVIKTYAVPRGQFSFIVYQNYLADILFVNNVDNISWIFSVNDFIVIL